MAGRCGRATESNKYDREEGVVGKGRGNNCERFQIRGKRAVYRLHGVRVRWTEGGGPGVGGFGWKREDGGKEELSSW